MVADLMSVVVVVVVMEGADARRHSTVGGLERVGGVRTDEMAGDGCSLTKMGKKGRRHRVFRLDKLILGLKARPWEMLRRRQWSWLVVPGVHGPGCCKCGWQQHATGVDVRV